MRYAVVFEHADECTWGASVPDLPGCFAVGNTKGNTKEDAQRRIVRAIQGYVERLIAQGQTIPKGTTVVSYVEVPLDQGSQR
jgi:predicted RNase H-like HicB family nuclease